MAAEQITDLCFDCPLMLEGVSMLGLTAITSVCEGPKVVRTSRTTLESGEVIQAEKVFGCGKYVDLDDSSPFVI